MEVKVDLLLLSSKNHYQIKCDRYLNVRTLQEITDGFREKFDFSYSQLLPGQSQH